LLGARFVWQFDLAEELEVFEGALEAALEAGFIAVDEVEFGAAGEIGEGSGDAVAGTSVFSGGFVEEIGFDAPKTALAPDGSREFLDEADFDAVGGIDPVNVLLVEECESIRAFALDEDASGEHAVTRGVCGGAELTRGRDRTTGKLSIGSGGYGSFG
jgi:hypothetical protein